MGIGDSRHRRQEANVRLGSFSYFLDFILLPPIILAMLLWPVAMSDSHNAVYVLLFFCFGLLTWTLIEYVFHRWLFHGGALFRALHDFHHEKPEELFGTPPVVGPVAIIIAFYIPAYALGVESTGGFAAGVLTGYLAYTSIHYAVHARLDGGAFLARARRRHMLHHFAQGDANFGVTTGLWDYLFGTSYAGRPAAGSTAS
jgi:sterol desaturase/sphingolipid hydroxylase (fatty acid hydroxylase superfamily)